MRSVLAVFLLIILVACQSPPVQTEEPTSKPSGNESGSEIAQATDPVEPASANQTITVFAAASLTDVVNEIGKIFEAQNPNIEFIYNYAGSQQLAHQISQGAPVDVFLSANQAQAEIVLDVGRARQEDIIPFAGNHLVVAVPASSPGLITTFSDLARPGIKLVVAAPEVPAGRYFSEVLEKAGSEASWGEEFVQSVQDNIVSYEENVRAVLSKVILGEADAGIVYYSDAILAGAEQVGLVEIPAVINAQATYYIVPVDDALSEPTIERYLQFILSDEVQPVLAEFGLLNTR